MSAMVDPGVELPDYLELPYKSGTLDLERLPEWYAQQERRRDELVVTTVDRLLDLTRDERRHAEERLRSFDELFRRDRQFVSGYFDGRREALSAAPQLPVRPQVAYAHGMVDALLYSSVVFRRAGALKRSAALEHTAKILLARVIEPAETR